MVYCFDKGGHVGVVDELSFCIAFLVVHPFGNTFFLPGALVNFGFSVVAPFALYLPSPCVQNTVVECYKVHSRHLVFSFDATLYVYCATD